MVEHENNAQSLNHPNNNPKSDAGKFGGKNIYTDNAAQLWAKFLQKPIRC